MPLLQQQTPASLVASTLTRVLGRNHLTNYIYVDFASGAGGPTPEIERLVNGPATNKEGAAEESSEGEEDDAREKAVFVLTDIAPHVPAWEAASKKSENLRFVAKPVDAADAPRDLVERVLGRRGSRERGSNKKVMRLFSLAFHHFDDQLAERILRNTIECGDGFA